MARVSRRRPPSNQAPIHPVSSKRLGVVLPPSPNKQAEQYLALTCYESKALFNDNLHIAKYLKNPPFEHTQQVLDYDMDLISQRGEDLGLLADVEGVSGDDKRCPLPSTRPCQSPRPKLLLGLLLTSTLLNLVFLVLSSYLALKSESPSKYANLQRNREEPYVRVTQYSSDNETLQEELWRDINIDYGVVALSDEWAAQHGLRTAQRFPWDQSKGIYILHAFHNLHCLKIIHISLVEYKHGNPQSRDWHHISHCMDALRRQIMCDADDTPRATEHRKEVVSGLLQHRKCRSWEELETFAKKHTACYKRPEDPERDGKPILERFKHCPPESGYVITDDYVPTDEFMVGLPEESIENI
ncbi:hypothetical protein F5B20DRAFT_166791 [Whalleya microplaca]|nr:hypothetical protein F5B20DRAFT_166791 [Whalleya microplaca]